jgi:hypothetical protein
MQTIDTDYLVIGAGTSGLAFADTLVTRTDAHITLIDRQGRPGGHWNDAYPFVTLHQPSAFYGVDSLELGSGRRDTVGLNEGFYELASGPEVSGYFGRVMNQRLLPSGRVTYRPLCNYLGNGVFESLLSGERTQVNVRKKVVDAAYFGPDVPATHTRRFAVAEGAQVLPPGALPGLWQTMHGAPVAALPRRFVVLGAGKTAMDACIWLIQSGAHPDSITWVVPRDSWLVNRATTQSGPEFFMEAIGGQADQMEAFAAATSTADLFARLEACGVMLRIDPTRTPTMFHFATVTKAEVEVLRRIRNVVRMGRVQAVAVDHMVLAEGRVAVEPGALFIDCTASAVEPRAPKPVFRGNEIVLQMVRMPQPAMSAALIAFVEARFETEEQKNRLCGAVPFPHTLDDYVAAMLGNMRNQFQWGQEEALRQWIRGTRLDGFGKLMASAARDDAPKQAVIKRLKEHAPAAMANLTRLVASGA